MAAVRNEGESEGALWTRLRSDGDERAREALLAMHLPYARVVAASYYARRINDEIEFDDYLQFATVGLIDSLDRFDPSHGALFRTYASKRMHGALVDGIGKMTEKQQQIAARQRLLEQRRATVKSGLEDEPRKTPEQLMEYVAKAGIAFAVSWLLDDTSLIAGGADSAHFPFYRPRQMQELRDEMKQLLKLLPDRERWVLQRHYYHEANFQEIANEMSLTRGRISQLHKAGLARLTEHLQRRGGPAMSL